ncbi:unannotated protein [freshwater metagenome]|uniref:Unannotated protein n=1 Tax=freshwater metagenome TaxID=449393 RepID=A0A6J6C6X0_9ZZZZ
MGGKFGCLVVNQVTKTFKRLELGRFNLFGEAFDLPEIRNRVSGRRNKKKRGLSVWLDFQRERSGELGVLTEGAQAGETAEVLAMLCKDPAANIRALFAGQHERHGVNQKPGRTKPSAPVFTKCIAELVKTGGQP